MVGYIYMTTNLINNMRYIGKHKSTQLQLNRYLGSGARIVQAIKEYGRKNFVCEVLEVCDTIEQLNAQERVWIAKYNATERNDFYNIAEGGVGSSGKVFGDSIKQAWQNDDYRQAHVQGDIKYWQDKDNRAKRTEINRNADHKSVWTEELRDAHRQKQKKVWSNTELKANQSARMKRVWADPDKIETQRQYNLGDKNPAYGKHYYVDGADNWIYCRPEDVPTGYYRAKYTWIYKDGIKVRHERGKPIPEGWGLQP